MIRQTLADRLRWWATLLEGRSIADRQHGWSGLWLSSEDAGVLLRLLREAAAQGSLSLEAGRAEAPPRGRAARSGRRDDSGDARDSDDDWPDTQPFGLDEPEAAARPRTASSSASKRLIWS